MGGVRNVPPPPHILVVDDDADVLDVIVEMLRDAGFIATAAASDVAMRAILSDKALVPVDVIVLDCSMPGEPSVQLARHAKKLRLPLVMISGDPAAMYFADDHGLQLLRKPFRTRQLLTAIDEAMTSGAFGRRDA